MTQVIYLIMVLLAIVVFVAIVGAPVWLIIYLIYQTKKTGKFPWRKLVIAIVLIVAFSIGITIISGGILLSTQDNFGVQSLDGNIIPDENATVNGDGGITLPKPND